MDPSINGMPGKKGNGPTEEQALLHLDPRSPSPSPDGDDHFGLPLPVTTGKGKKPAASAEATKNPIQAEILQEDEAIRKTVGKKGAIAMAAVGTVILGGAGVLTAKSAGAI